MFVVPRFHIPHSIFYIQITMAKTKEQKNKLIDYLRVNLAEKKAAIIIDYKGLTVKELEALRNKLGDLGIKFSVTKNTMLKIALSDQKLEIDNEILNRPIAITFGDDEVVVSKEMAATAKELEAMEILGGIIDRKIVDSETISRLSLLPGREELYAKLVGTFNAPINGVVNVLAASIRGLVNVLNNYKESIS